MKRFILVSALLGLGFPLLAEEVKQYKPLSLDPPPASLEGLKAPLVLASLRRQGYSKLKDKPLYCSPVGLYLWSAAADGHTGTVSVKSYTGQDDVVGFRLQISGFVRSDPENPRENMQELIATLAEQSQVICQGEEQKRRLATTLNEKLPDIVYSGKGKQAKTGAVIQEEAFLCESFRVHVLNELKNAVAITIVTFTPAESRTWTWTEESGQVTLEAQYVSHDGKHVKMAKEGYETEVPLAKLSVADAQWLAGRGPPSWQACRRKLLRSHQHRVGPLLRIEIAG